MEIKVRFLVSSQYKESSLTHENWLETAYQNGVPMGSDLPNQSAVGSSQSAVPAFLVWAIKDAEGANLDRIQVIKGWVDENGEAQEKVFEVVWAGARKVDKNGQLPPLKSTVNVKKASYSNDIGAIQLKKVWKDLEFDANQNAFYYVRVLEIPTPR